MVREPGSWQLGTVVREPATGGTLGGKWDYLPLKKLSKNPLDIPKGYLVREKSSAKMNRSHL